jgi:predicted dehydrogenase
VAGEGRGRLQGRIGWGILGTGKIARIIARAIGASTTGVGSREPARATAFATELSVPTAHHGYRHVLEDPDVELVYVATHHPDHRTWAVAAAEAGKHVLCEKPLAVGHAAASEIVDAARRRDVFLMEAFAYRCHPQTMRLVQLLTSGAIGEVRMIDAAFGYDAGASPTNYLHDQELGGGSILDVGCYATSMCLLVARVAGGGEVIEPEHVVGTARIGTTTQVDHAASASLSFRDGPLARVACSIDVDLESSVRIDGSEGRITVPSPWLPGRIGDHAEVVLERHGAARDVIDIRPDADVYAIEVDAVGSFLRAGERSPAVMPWEESLANMRTLDRWRASVGMRYESDGSDAEILRGERVP